MSIKQPPRSYRLGSLGLDVLLIEPLEHALVAEHKLAQRLHHAQPLETELLDRLLDQVLVRLVEPLAIAVVDLHGRAFPARACVLLALEHVEDRVDGAEGAGAAAAGGAVNDDGAAVGGLGLVWGADAVDGADDCIGLLDETEEVGWMCRRAKVGPVGVLKLCDLAHALERLVVVGERELANSDVRLLGRGCWRGGIIVRIREERRLGLRGCRFPLAQRRPERLRTMLVALDPRWLKRSAVFPELLQM